MESFQWNQYSICYLNTNAIDLILQVELGQPNIIFNVPHPSLLLHIYEKITRSVFIPLIQEIKRDIIYGHIKHLGATGHSTAAVNSSFKLHSTQTLLLTTIQYIGLVKYHKGIEALCSSRHQPCSTKYCNYDLRVSCFSLLSTWLYYPILWQPFLLINLTAHTAYSLTRADSDTNIHKYQN